MSRSTAATIGGALVLGAVAILVAMSREYSSARVLNPSAPTPQREARRPIEIDTRRQQLAGIRTAPVTRGTLTPTARATGVVAFDETRLTDVSLRLDGWVRELFVNYTGQPVRKGQPLLSLYSEELFGAQLQYLAAVRSRDQLSDAQRRERDGLERLVETPRRRLRNWDVPDDQIQALEEAGQALDAVVFRSPADGVVIARTAVRGMHVEAGKSLYTLADTSTMWIRAQFSPGDAVALKAGQHVDVSIGNGPTLSGKVLFSSPSLSELSRTTGVQIEVPNHEGNLRAGMTATVEAALDPLSGLIVPADAVIDSGRRQTVFVREGEGRFDPRTVVLGPRVNDRIIVTSGLGENEQVVAGATFLLDSESQLQAALESYGHTELQDSGEVSDDVHASITFSTVPDPPKVGTSRFRVHLTDAKAVPITDASLSVRFYMAPMPSMNMPPMRAEAALTHTAAGEYRGTGMLPMAGAWEVTITAARSGRTIAERRTFLVVR